eukprot:3995529-Amphidinium_carterae.1
MSLKPRATHIQGLKEPVRLTFHLRDQFDQAKSLLEPTPIGLGFTFLKQHKPQMRDTFGCKSQAHTKALNFNTSSKREATGSLIATPVSSPLPTGTRSIHLNSAIKAGSAAKITFGIDPTRQGLYIDLYHRITRWVPLDLHHRITRWVFSQDLATQPRSCCSLA